MRPPSEWQRLNRRTVDPYFPDPSVLPRRRDLRPGDDERILDAVRYAWPQCYGGEDPAYPRLLAVGCDRLGWPEEHPLSIWTVAIYANRFPLYWSDGRLARAWPDQALRCAYEDCFWADPDLVQLAAHRCYVGWTRTSEVPPEVFAAQQAAFRAKMAGRS